jgi:hypothetical protein
VLHGTQEVAAAIDGGRWSRLEDGGKMTADGAIGWNGTGNWEKLLEEANGVLEKKDQ